MSKERLSFSDWYRIIPVLPVVKVFPANCFCSSIALISCHSYHLPCRNAKVSCQVTSKDALGGWTWAKWLRCRVDVRFPRSLFLAKATRSTGLQMYLVYLLISRKASQCLDTLDTFYTWITHSHATSIQAMGAMTPCMNWHHITFHSRISSAKPQVHLFSHILTTANSCATTFQRSQQSPRSWHDSRLPSESLKVRFITVWMRSEFTIPSQIFGESLPFDLDTFNDFD